MRKSSYSEEQIALALRHVEAGAPVGEVCRKIQVAESTFFRWRNMYGGLGIAMIRRLKQLKPYWGSDRLGSGLNRQITPGSQCCG